MTLRLLRRWAGGLSLRGRLLWGILLPVGLFVVLNTVSLYRQALAAADTAYDRTLLASAKSIGELLEVSGTGTEAHVVATVPYSALEAFEADNRSRIFYKVSGFNGEMISGFPELATWRGRVPDQGPYSALVDFYDDVCQGVPVRVAVLLQPVAGNGAQGMATIQVAETLELRRTLAQRLLVDTLWRQAALLALIATVVVVVVHRTTQPVRRLSERLRHRDDADLSPLDVADAPRELQPLVEATNQVMGRLDHLLAHQKRFVRDTAHQLRTPLAVLKAQVQSALRGDMAPGTALAEINQTVDRATQLANQMLSLAKVEQLRQQGDAPVLDWAEIVRAVALDVAPLVAERDIEFDLEAVEAPVRGHEWALRELVRNLLHNAIRHTPDRGRLTVRLVGDGRHVALTIADSGPGIGDEMRQRLFQPFATGDSRHGTGLGLAICQEIVRSLGGQLSLDNRLHQGRVTGLDATVRLELATLSI
ncbi:sensor histidine kinase [Ideonella sp. A 288]|uniref:sensor histidine kinase n=1 Tax=Ideonella sp. A 288 TaxID=1962181 RepID=UPI001F3CF96E|nr:sensor histidine kinase [Ideonella sp. A 288]